MLASAGMSGCLGGRGARGMRQYMKMGGRGRGEGKVNDTVKFTRVVELGIDGTGRS